MGFHEVRHLGLTFFPIVSAFTGYERFSKVYKSNNFIGFAIGYKLFKYFNETVIYNFKSFGHF